MPPSNKETLFCSSANIWGLNTNLDAIHHHVQEILSITYIFLTEIQISSEMTTSYLFYVGYDLQMFCRHHGRQFICAMFSYVLFLWWGTHPWIPVTKFQPRIVLFPSLLSMCTRNPPVARIRQLHISSLPSFLSFVYVVLDITGMF